MATAWSAAFSSSRCRCQKIVPRPKKQKNERCGKNGNNSSRKRPTRRQQLRRRRRPRRSLRRGTSTWTPRSRSCAAKLSEFYRQHCREEPRTQIRIGCGLALDCAGNELIVRRALLVDLAARLSAADLERVKRQPQNIYVSLCYCAQPVDPARPALSDACGVTPECVYGKWRDPVLRYVSVAPPQPPQPCETPFAPCPPQSLLRPPAVAICPAPPPPHTP